MILVAGEIRDRRAIAAGRAIRKLGCLVRTRIAGYVRCPARSGPADAWARRKRALRSAPNPDALTVPAYASTLRPNLLRIAGRTELAFRVSVDAAGIPGVQRTGVRLLLRRSRGTKWVSPTAV